MERPKLNNYYWALADWAAWVDLLLKGVVNVSTRLSRDLKGLSTPRTTLWPWWLPPLFRKDLVIVAIEIIQGIKKATVIAVVVTEVTEHVNIAGKVIGRVKRRIAPKAAAKENICPLDQNRLFVTNWLLRESIGRMLDLRGVNMQLR